MRRAHALAPVAYHGEPFGVALRFEPHQNEAFPSLRLSRADILSSWAGLRALIANPDGTPSDISRAHEIRLNEPGWWDVSGGKLTTYRLMAEQTIDRILHYLGRPKGVCRTAVEPLLPIEDDARFSNIVPPDFSRDAVVHYVQHEWALSLTGVFVRRTSWHYYHRRTHRRTPLAPFPLRRPGGATTNPSPVPKQAARNVSCPRCSRRAHE